ncbi:MAG TPA: hypothetical protein VG166_11140 [Caulobacteraceae bacterium]|jgi:hypothetical protein|nr:hypothetical protein [Caulobacteraceae bacterium]
MAAISIGEAIGEGFGLIGRRPLLVLIWGAANTAWGALITALMMPSMRGMLEAQKSILNSGGVAATPSSAEVMARLAPLMQFEGVLLLIGLVSAFVTVVLNCAVFRSVLRPEEKAFAYLRLGSAELMLFFFFLGAYFVLAIGFVVALVPVFILVAIAGAAHAGLAAGLIAFLAVVALLVLLVWIMLRLSLVGPMTVQDGRFHFLDAWRLTRGHAGALFAVGLCLLVIAIVVGILSFVVTMAVGGAAAFGAFQSALRGAPASPASLMPVIGVGLVVRYLIAIPLSGGLLAIIGAPWARAFRDLAQPDVAATFS